MSDHDPSERDAQEPSSRGPIAAVAIGLGFVVFVVMRGFTGQSVVTWIVASAIGTIVFLVAQAARRRRAK